MCDNLIIGIGGVTCGGKTTLCSKLQDEIQGIYVSILNMDDFYWPEDSPNHVPLKEFDNYANWDDVCSVDWDKLVDAVKSWKDQSDIDRRRLLLLEGILIYNNQDLLSFFDKKYYITVDKDCCWERRKERSYLPPEPEGYFEVIAWPCYLKLREEIDGIPNIVYIDGSSDPDKIFRETFNDVQKFIETAECS